MLSGTLDRKSVVSLPRFANPIVRLTRWIQVWLEERRNRRAIAQLLEHDDRLLKDIGITRADVEFALGRANSRETADYLTTRRRAPETNRW